MRFHIIVSAILIATVGVIALNICKTNNCEPLGKLRIRDPFTIEEAIIFEVTNAAESEAEVN